MLRSKNVSHTTIAWSTLLEMASIAAAPVLIATIAGGSKAVLVLGIDKLPWIVGIVATLATTCILVVSLLVFRNIITISGIWKNLKSRIPRLCFAQICHLIFFTLMGLLLYLLVGINLQGNQPPPPLTVIIAANAVAWVAGFVTPGAPGGIGVREFVLVMLLKPYGLAEVAVTVAAQMRLVTVAGDFIFYLLAKVMVASLTSNTKEKAI